MKVKKKKRLAAFERSGEKNPSTNAIKKDTLG